MWVNRIDSLYRSTSEINLTNGKCKYYLFCKATNLQTQLKRCFKSTVSELKVKHCFFANYSLTDNVSLATLNNRLLSSFNFSKPRFLSLQKRYKFCMSCLKKIFYTFFRVGEVTISKLFIKFLHMTYKIYTIFEAIENEVLKN